ncbi:MAG: glycosyltransferase family 4 protein [Gammaproteobacteria bacterium]|nr:glycosyltransferase family 4 protein [Gammaproteobacteria bacterium]
MVADVALMLLVGAFAVTVVLQWLTVWCARRLSIHAHPNERSFHDRPTPTGGGVAFVAVMLGYLVWLALSGAASALALAAAGTAVAAAGLWDDLRETSPALRLLVQGVAAGVCVWILLPQAQWLLVLAVFIGLVWHINLYNFMDGIDGIAGVQTLVFAVGAHVVAGGVAGWPGDLLWLCVGSVTAFLVFNWPPARVFMGDVGSGFLGLLIGALAVLLWQQQSLPLAASLILLAGFWLDASYTLIVRILTGQSFTQAHRSHLYQKVALRRGHLWTTVCFLLYAVFWLMPLAWLSARFPADFPPATLLWVLPAAAPLAAAAWWLRAGTPEPQNHE